MTTVTDFKPFIEASLQESIKTKQDTLDNCIDEIDRASNWLLETFEQGGKLILFGNGGSAADAQHIAAEFVGRFEKERRALPAIALTTDTSALTALSNDYSVELIFKRQLEALGRSGDLAFAISTSGNSPNVLAAIKAAQEKNIRTVGFTGETGGELSKYCDLTIRVPSKRTARIQECHIAILHAICQTIDQTKIGDTTLT